MMIKENSRINPITRLDYPDPDVIRVGNTYYMVSTTMHFMPGCEILRSYDLCEWEHLTYVYDRLDSTAEQCLKGKENCYGKGMWAASLRYHKGRYYICFVANDTGKTYLYTAENIKGPWRKQLVEGFYHDCSLLFDDDKIYIVYGNKQVYLTELKTDLSGPKEGGLHRMLVDDAGNTRLGFEGSHIYKHNGRYYLFMIHSQADRWMRTEACYCADALTDQFIGGDILIDTMGYCGQGVAQGGIVDTPDGRWYAVLFQDRGAVGRIPVLIPLEWKENVRVTSMVEPGKYKETTVEDLFPVLGENGKIPQRFEIPEAKEKHTLLPLVDSDDFDETDEADKQRYATFGFKSCWQFNHEPELSCVALDTKNKRMVLTCGKICTNLEQAVNTLTQRLLYPGCNVEVTVDASMLRQGDFAGICALQGTYGLLAVTKEADGFALVIRTREAEDDSLQAVNQNSIYDKEWEKIPIDGEAPIRLRLAFDFTEMRDTVRFFYQAGQQWVAVGPEHKLYFKLDHFTGCRVGLFAYATETLGGKAAFSHFVYEEGQSMA